MFKQTLPRFQISLRPTFSNSIFGIVMKLHDESAAVKFLGLFNMLTVEARSETKLVRYLTNHFFGSLQFQK